MYPSCAGQPDIGSCCTAEAAAAPPACACDPESAAACRYRRVTRAPLVWEATALSRRRCVCV